MRIFLIGYMTSGKTTLGRYLAKSLCCPFIDMDEYIESKEGCLISEMFLERGEIEFRKLERKYLTDIVLLKNVVVATGGGTPCFNNNIDLINSTGLSVYLETSEEVLLSRLLTIGQNRPLIKGKTLIDLKKYIEKHFRPREIFYRKANIIINGDDWNVKRLINEILGKI